MEKKLYDSIEDYLKLGWSAFPTKITSKIEKGEIKKVPNFPIENGVQTWKKYQTQRISIQDIELEWFDFPHVGIATGMVSGITIIDLDCKDKTKVPNEFFDTYVVESKNGYHFYFKYCQEAKQSQNAVQDIDIRNDGGFVFAPPSEYSLHNSIVASYKIINDVIPLDFPIEWYRKTFNQEKNNWKEKIIHPISEGSRNMDFTSIVGGLLHQFPEDDWATIVWKMVENSNSVQDNPLPMNELKTLFLSISKKELARRHTGGDIKDIKTETTEDEIRINITLEHCIACFKVKNITTNLLEANVITWLKKSHGLTHEMPFFLKIKSDSNKEQWARVLSKAFDKKEDKEVYPWTILISKVSTEIEKKIREHKQDFLLSEIETKPLTWVYEPFIQENQINTFFGLGGSGKTMLAIYLSSVISKIGTKTLLIDYENDGSNFKDKLIRMLPTSEINNNFIYFDSEQIPLPEQVDKIKEVIKRHNIKLVIVDSASLSSGDSTSDEKSALRLISALKLLKKTIVLIAHQRKNDGDKTPIGSIQFENQARNVWNFKSCADEFDNSILHVVCTHTKTNNTYKRNPIGFKIVFGDIIGITNENAMDNFEDKGSVIDRIKKILENDSPLTAKDISSSLGVKEATVRTTLNRGQNNGTFKNTEKGWILELQNDEK